MIGRKAAPGEQQDTRSELERHDDAHGRRVAVRQLGEHEPVLGDALHPGSDVGDKRSAGPHPIVKGAQ